MKARPVHERRIYQAASGYSKEKMPDLSGFVPTPKARLVATGFQRIQWPDYSSSYAPEVKILSLSYLVEIVVQFDLERSQMDIFTAFLIGEPGLHYQQRGPRECDRN